MEKDTKALKIEISTPFIKLDQLLKFAALCQSAGEAKMRIIDGLVLVDGEKCLQRGRKIRPGQRVCALFCGREIEVSGPRENG